MIKKFGKMKVRTGLVWSISLTFGIFCLWGVLSERRLLAGEGEGEAGNSLALPDGVRAGHVPDNWIPGSMIFWTKEDCELFVNCTQNNFFTTYGVFAVPVDPEARAHACTKQDLIQGVCSRQLQLNGNDAILLFGRTVPDARYFNFLLNQIDRWDGGTGRELTESSIGLGINHLTLRTLDPDPFDALFLMIVTASTATANTLKADLIESGIPEEGINVYLFHRDFANGHLGEHADNLVFMNRIGVPDEASLADYTASPPLTGYLIRGEATGTGDVDFSDPWVPRSDPVALDQKDDLLDLVTDIILQNWPEHGMPARVIQERIHHVEPDEDCRSDVPRPENCHWDNPDGLYVHFKWREGKTFTPYLDDEEDFFILAGVDHGLFQLETYFAYFLTRESDRVAFAGFKDVDIVGSAAPYRPKSGDGLFAYKIALNCHGDPACFEVPTGEGGVEPGDEMILTGRIYLDPVSMTGPDPQNFVPSILLWYDHTSPR